MLVERVSYVVYASVGLDAGRHPDPLHRRLGRGRVRSATSAASASARCGTSLHYRPCESTCVPWRVSAGGRGRPWPGDCRFGRRMSRKAISTQPQHARGSASKSSRARRPRNGPPGRGRRDGRSRSPPLEAIQWPPRGFVRQPRRDTEALRASRQPLYCLCTLPAPTAMLTEHATAAFACEGSSRHARGCSSGAAGRRRSRNRR